MLKGLSLPSCGSVCASTNPDFAGTLRALRTARHAGSSALRHESLFSPVGRMSTEELLALAPAMNGIPMGQLITAMICIGAMLIEGDDHACLGREMVDIGNDLCSVRDAVAENLHARGEPAPAAKTHDFRLVDTSARVQNALRAVFDVELGTQGNINVKAGVAPEKTRLAIERNLQRICARAIEQGSLGDNRNHEDRWQENRQATGVQTQAQRQVLSLLGNTSAMARILALKPNDSPTRLPDGATGQLRGGVANASFTLRVDGIGNLLADCGYTIENATSCGPLGMIQLRHGLGHAHFAFTMEISPDGDVSVPGPVRFRYDAQPHSLARSYPIPDSLHDIFGPGASSAMRADYHRYCKLHHFAKNHEFLDAMQAFNSDPKLERAQQLHLRFIQDGAEMQVNLSREQRDHIQRTLQEHESAGLLAPRQWRELFLPAYREVWTAMEAMTMGSCASFPVWLRRLDAERI
jgi:hypothetical protein